MPHQNQIKDFTLTQDQAQEYVKRHLFQMYQALLDDKTIVGILMSVKGLPFAENYSSSSLTHDQHHAIITVTKLLTTKFISTLQDILRTGGIWGQFELYALQTYKPLEPISRVKKYKEDSFLLKTYLAKNPNIEKNPEKIIEAVFNTHIDHYDHNDHHDHHDHHKSDKKH